LNGFISLPWISLMIIIFFTFVTIQHLPLEILLWYLLTFKFSPINHIQTILINDQSLHVSFHSLKHLHLRCNMMPFYSRSSVLCCLLSLPCSEAPSNQEENQTRNNKSACCSGSHCCSHLTV